MRAVERGGLARHRPDIQGLRGLAVALVVLDHARIGPFQGGYVGVDVFFVISGFLITGLLLGEATRTGRISLLAFYGRRARRILPAATLVIVSTVVGSLLLFSAVQADAVVHDALWATLFAANVTLARQGTDYFHADATPSPLQHYWSLAVEEQFYVVWPVLVLLAAVLAVRWARRHRPESDPAPVGGAVSAVLVVVVVASFVWSVIEADRNPVGAYFSPWTRAWELGVGGLLACLALGRVRSSPAFAALLGWSGLVAVVAAAVRYDADTVFPAAAAALPVLGAAALLASGLHAQSAWGPRRLLEVAPLRVLGDWSYSVYLWHWPALVLAGAVWGVPHGWSGAAVVAVVLALSALTYRYVENPVRRGRILHRRRVGAVLLYPAGVLVTAPFLLGGAAVVHGEVSGGGPAITTAAYGQAGGRSVPVLSRDPAVALVQASVEAAHNGVAVPAHLEPSLLDLSGDVPSLGGCEYYLLGNARPLCPRGDVDGPRTLVLIGDSHARQWIPAIDPLARAGGFRAYYLVREGCPAADVTPWKVGGGPNLDCQHFQNWARSEVARLRPDVVVLASAANQRGFTDGDGRVVADVPTMTTMYRAGMEREIDAVAASAGRVVVIGDPPGIAVRSGDCLSARGASLAGCLSAPDADSVLFTDAQREAARATGVQFVETGSWFCWDDQCPSVIGRYVPHRDRGHVSESYAASLSVELGRRLRLASGPA